MYLVVSVINGYEWEWSCKLLASAGSELDAGPSFTIGTWSFDWIYAIPWGKTEGRAVLLRQKMVRRLCSSLAVILLKSPHYEYLVCACIIMHRHAQAADFLFAYRLHGWLFLSFLRLTIKYDATVIEPIWSSWPLPLHHHQDRLYHLWDRTRSRTSGHSGVKVG